MESSEVEVLRSLVDELRHGPYRLRIWTETSDYGHRWTETIEVFLGDEKIYQARIDDHRRLRSKVADHLLSIGLPTEGWRSSGTVVDFTTDR